MSTSLDRERFSHGDWATSWILGPPRRLLRPQLLAPLGSICQARGRERERVRDRAGESQRLRQPGKEAASRPTPRRGDGAGSAQQDGAASYLEAAENEVLLRGEEEVHLRGAGGIVMGRVSQEHGPSHFQSPRSILEQEPHRQGGPQVNHGRRKQEQPGRTGRSAAAPPAPSPPAQQPPRRAGTWAPAETRRSWTPRSAPRGAAWLQDQERSDPSVCLLLSGRPPARSRVDSGPCSSPGPAKAGKPRDNQELQLAPGPVLGAGGHPGHLGH